MSDFVVCTFERSKAIFVRKKDIKNVNLDYINEETLLLKGLE